MTPFDRHRQTAAGWLELGLPLEAHEELEEIEPESRSFALYGFPESHAISFALLAYASPYLKVHRPTEFLAGLLNNQPMGFYSPPTLIRDARQHDVHLRPVCVVSSM